MTTVTVTADDIKHATGGMGYGVIGLALRRAGFPGALVAGRGKNMHLPDGQRRRTAPGRADRGAGVDGQSQAARHGRGRQAGRDAPRRGAVRLPATVSVRGAHRTDRGARCHAMPDVHGTDPGREGRITGCSANQAPGGVDARQLGRQLDATRVGGHVLDAGEAGPGSTPRLTAVDAPCPGPVPGRVPHRLHILKHPARRAKCRRPEQEHRGGRAVRPPKPRHAVSSLPQLRQARASSLGAPRR